MSKRYSYALTFAGGMLAFWILQLFYAKGQTQFDQQAPRHVDLSVVEGRSYRVRRVVDGDTIVLDNGVHVRYAGINTPETGRYIKEAAPLGDRARERNAEMTEEKQVRIRFGKDLIDAYGRVIGHVTVVNDQGAECSPEEILLKEGLARVFALGLTTEDYGHLTKLEEEAKAGKAGIWGLKRKDDTVGTYSFVAASKSDVFHYATCPTAQRLRAADMTGFESLEKAKASGRKMCSRCAGRAAEGHAEVKEDPAAPDGPSPQDP